MYVNKCIKCGKEFETKNPKRVICPDCLYPERRIGEENPSPIQPAGGENYNSFQSEQFNPVDNQQFNNQYNNPQPYDNQGFNNGYPQRNPYQQGYNRPQNYNRPQGGYQQNYNPNYQHPRYSQGNDYQQNRGYGDRRPNRYNPQGGGYNQNRPYGNRRPNNNRFGQNKFNSSRSGGFKGGKPKFNKKPQQRHKTLLVSRDQLNQIELLYKAMLPLPNPDAHEVIGEKISLEPRKVFFGINLVRQKMKLPKLPFPKRKLAISPEQMYAIQNLYVPLLPLPPIGCHKIIAAQLKMDEWRVHVGIGLIRKKLGLERWNPLRDDAPEEFKQQALDEANKPKKKLVLLKKPKEEKEEVKPVAKKKEVAPVVIRKLEDIEGEDVPVTEETETVEAKPKRTTKKKAETTETEEVTEKPKRGRKKKEESEPAAEVTETEAKPKRGRKKKED